MSTWVLTSPTTDPTALATGLMPAWSIWGRPSRGSIVQHRDVLSPDDAGWCASATYRVLPWIQLVVKQEDFRRSAIGADLRNRGTTGGVNLDFNGGKVRLMANYVSRKIGTPGTRRGTLITQAQVKF
jgi:hypothetical protein